MENNGCQSDNILRVNKQKLETAGNRTMYLIPRLIPARTLGNPWEAFPLDQNIQFVVNTTANCLSTWLIVPIVFKIRGKPFVPYRLAPYPTAGPTISPPGAEFDQSPRRVLGRRVRTQIQLRVLVERCYWVSAQAAPKRDALGVRTSVSSV